VTRVLAAAALVVLVAVSAAGAVTLRGTAKDDRLVGTGRRTRSRDAAVTTGCGDAREAISSSVAAGTTG
jgi:hypothetical protein